MPHQVGKEGDIVALVQKILGEPVPEGVGMDHLRVEAELLGKTLEPERQPSGGNGVAVPVPEQVTALDTFFLQPLSSRTLSSIKKDDPCQKGSSFWSSTKEQNGFKHGFNGNPFYRFLAETALERHRKEAFTRNLLNIA